MRLYERPLFLCGILTVFLRKRKRHGEGDRTLRAYGINGAAVQLHKLPGNGQPQPRAALRGGPVSE